MDKLIEAVSKFTIASYKLSKGITKDNFIQRNKEFEFAQKKMVGEARELKIKNKDLLKMINIFEDMANELEKEFKK